jgi:DNA-binding MarR family transcriptional regulator
MATTSRGGARELPGAERLLREVARLHVRAQRATLACDGASLTQCTILTELGRAPAMTLAELARRLRLDKGWTSRAVDQLVADGLVEKVAGEHDRRTIALSLTRAGRTQHRRLEALLDDQVARVIGRVPPAKQRGVARALGLLHDAYLAERAEQAGESDATDGISCARAS